MSKKTHTKRMNRVIQAIESSLDNETDITELSALACYSEFHFHRLFRSFTGESIYAYRKRLILERAVRHLQHSDDSITQIAFAAGYDNQSSFNKAFKRQFSCTPGQVRKQGFFIDPMQIRLKPDRSFEMEAEIVTFEDTPVICARETGAYAESAAKAWERIMTFAYSNGLMHGNVRRIGISYDDPNVTDAERIRYEACVDIEADVSAADNIKQQTIGGGRYAKFLHEGAYENFQHSYSYIFNEWLPDSNYKVQEKPCFEVYLNDDPRGMKPEDLRTEIYIPIE